MRSVRVIVSGRVQGVGYRWFARETAMTCGIVGWVRNRRDGTVEAELHGDGEALGEVISALRQGPRSARVDALQITDIGFDRQDAFEIRPTA
ncbi:acylphosphatase [Microbacterium sp. NPDC055312]